MNDLVDPSDAFAGNAFDALAAKAEPRFRAALAERGVSDPLELPGEVAAEIFRKVLLETAALHMPAADLKGLDRLVRTHAHPLFAPAVQRARAQTQGSRDAFAPAVGSDCAVVMAGYGLPVAPFDKREPRLLGELSDDIDMVAKQFAKFKTAFVGYSTCAAPFYVLLTDCIRTLRQRVSSDGRFRDVRYLIERSGMRWPPDNSARFQHAGLLFVREVDDKIPSIGVLDPSPYRGSIVLYAGWLEGNEPQGSPNGGYVPVPMQFVGDAIAKPALASCLARPVGSRPAMH
jgi:hypothetical protein